MKIARSRSDRALFAQPMHSSAYSRYSFAVAMAQSLARVAGCTGCQKTTQVAWRQDYDLVTWDRAASPYLALSLVRKCPSHHNGSLLAFDDRAPPALLGVRLEDKCELIRDFVTRWYDELNAEIGDFAEPASNSRERLFRPQWLRSAVLGASALVRTDFRAPT